MAPPEKSVVWYLGERYRAILGALLFIFLYVNIYVWKIQHSKTFVILNDSFSFEPGHSISYKIACIPNEDSDQTKHLRSLISLHRVLYG